MHPEVGASPLRPVWLDAFVSWPQLSSALGVAALELAQVGGTAVAQAGRRAGAFERYFAPARGRGGRLVSASTLMAAHRRLLVIKPALARLLIGVDRSLCLTSTGIA